MTERTLGAEGEPQAFDRAEIPTFGAAELFPSAWEKVLARLSSGGRGVQK